MCHLYCRAYHRTLSACALAWICASGCTQQPEPEKVLATNAFPYPLTAKVAVTDDYHGTIVADPYRWLEDLDSASTSAWVAAQNRITLPYLSALPEREAIRARLTAIWNHERYSTPIKRGQFYYYFHNDGLQSQNVLYRSKDPAIDGKVVLDPNGFSEDGTVSLAALSISPNGRFAAYAKSQFGSDWRRWHLLDLDSLEHLSDELDFTKFTDAAWRADDSGFYYSRYPQAEGGAGDGQQAVSVYFHAIGTTQQQDTLVFSEPEQPRRNPYASVSDDGRFLVHYIQEGYLSNALYYRRLPASRGEFVRLLDDWDALYTFIGNVDDTFYLQTTLSAANGRVIAIDLDHPQRSAWREVIAEQPAPLQSVDLVGGKLLARYLEDVKSRINVYELDGRLLDTVTLPGIGSASGFEGTATDSETFYSYSSFTNPTSIYRYDVAQGRSQLLRRPKVDIDSDAFVTKQVFYPSRDGTLIPMFLVHRKGLKLTADHPTLLYGYGGFKVSLTPRFSVSRTVWLERGGVLAIANLRGGGEYGKQWHLAGANLQKQNVIDDFIAAAQWLIDNRYTQPTRLAIQGGSNGGLLVGAALTQRPELFAAALPAVGVFDMLRYHLASANARNWATDYGLSENPADFKAQLAYSPLHNLQPNVCYPATLITTSDHDDRVVPWHSYKFAAALQARQHCSRPTLLRVETRAGHGAGTPTWMRIEELADRFAFVEAMLQKPGKD